MYIFQEEPLQIETNIFPSINTNEKQAQHIAHREIPRRYRDDFVHFIEVCRAIANISSFPINYFDQLAIVPVVGRSYVAKTCSLLVILSNDVLCSSLALVILLLSPDNKFRL